MATTAELTSALLRAEKAYEDLLLGRAPSVLVDQNGERVHFNVADPKRLRAYIDELRASLNLSPKSGRPLGPMRPLF